MTYPLTHHANLQDAQRRADRLETVLAADCPIRLRPVVAPDPTRDGTGWMVLALADAQRLGLVD